ncbi:MAG: ammonia-forming cytochrome c nitrite reductase subunit c552 [Desulfobaccales bacterium]|nr:ammonia-forming cytochrome c nitrite reductase subunit c552 [Desulfobaccales bacterium]
MKDRTVIFIIRALVLLGVMLLFAACSPQKPEPVKTVSIADGDIDPANWGKAYPLEYDSWLKTKEPKPPKSRYKKGYDTDLIIYDKLSEFPFMALLFNGWGFGVEYNEPRGHYYMIIDQLDIDPSRLKAGGVCLSCKSPYAPKLEKELGLDYFKLPYMDVHAKIPTQFQKLGVSCVDCHDNKTLAPKITHPVALKSIGYLGLKPDQLTRQQLRSLTCAQCHVTYVIKKDADMKSIDLFFPWQGSKEGDISIENIIKVIKSDPAYLEWKQNVTGFKVGFIRHPEYEFYTRNSTHWQAGVACADCHMPYMRVGANKISDHDVMSPLKNDLKACQQCHAESAQWLKDRVIATQDRTVSLMNRAGYAVAVAAKLFEMAHKAQAEGKTIDKDLYEQAKDLYLEAFYRVIFMGAENSVGFHNPTEAGRILGDAVALAGKSEALLRQALTKAGVAVPAEVNLELAKYLNNRGVKELNFKPEFEFKDPFGTQEMLTPARSLGK